jgi:GT2 family glycosyltransferase
MTTLNRPDFLKKTLIAIANQSYSEFEVVISDNDPNGSAEAVVTGINDSRFSYFPNGENLGMIESFNRSIKRANTEYVVMITDDDPVYPTMLETLFDLEKKYPGYGMYLGACNWFCNEPDLAEFYNCKVGVNSCLAHRPIDEVKQYDGSSFLLKFFDFGIFPNYLWSTAIVRRDILIEMGGVPDYGTPFLGDYAFISLMASQKGCVTINTALGHQTLHRQNFGRAQNDQLIILGPRFIEYVSPRLRKLKNWPEIDKKMRHFVAVWIVRHLGFLKTYNRHIGNKINSKEIRECERQIFKIGFMKPYKIKYYLLTRFPSLHNYIVRLKKKMKKNEKL